MNKTDLKRILAKAAIDPKAPGVWKIIADCDQNYLRQRAIELLSEAEFHEFDNNLNKALTMISIALYKNKGDAHC